MKKIIDWLENGAGPWSLIYAIPILTFFKIVYATCFFYGLVKYLPDNESCSSNTFDMSQIADLGIVAYIFIFTAALSEELVFRLIPIFTIQLLLSFLNININFKILILFISIIIVSIVFGYLHGNYINVFIQGVGGLIYSLVYLKYGGYYLSNQYSSFDPYDAFIISTVFHFFYNTTIFIFL